MNRLKEDAPIQADIHQLLVDGTQDLVPRKAWGSYTTGRFTVYAAKGAHVTMFESANLVANVEILRGILDKII